MREIPAYLPGAIALRLTAAVPAIGRLKDTGWNPKTDTCSFEVGTESAAREEVWPLKDVVFLDTGSGLPIGEVLKVDGGTCAAYFPSTRDAAEESPALKWQEARLLGIAQFALLSDTELAAAAAFSPHGTHLPMPTASGICQTPSALDLPGRATSLSLTVDSLHVILAGAGGESGDDGSDVQERASSERDSAPNPDPDPDVNRAGQSSSETSRVLSLYEHCFGGDDGREHMRHTTLPDAVARLLGKRAVVTTPLSSVALLRTRDGTLLPPGLTLGTVPAAAAVPWMDLGPTRALASALGTRSGAVVLAVALAGQKIMPLVRAGDVSALQAALGAVTEPWWAERLDGSRNVLHVAVDNAPERVAVAAARDGSSSSATTTARREAPVSVGELTTSDFYHFLNFDPWAADPHDLPTPSRNGHVSAPSESSVPASGGPADVTEDSGTQPKRARRISTEEKSCGQVPHASIRCLQLLLRALKSTKQAETLLMQQVRKEKWS